MREGSRTAGPRLPIPPGRPGSVTRLAAAAGAIALTAAAASCGANGQSNSFGWFRAASAPGDWKTLTVPSTGARLAFPPQLSRVRSDPGTVSVGLTNASHQIVVYLNATPQQGAESVSNWPTFRIDHLKDEGARAAHRDAAASELDFSGSRGSCLTDDYVTRVASHHYREIACYVQGAGGGSVLVAATLADSWNRYRSLLQEVVEAYRA
jgi:hypothetical protein